MESTWPDTTNSSASSRKVQWQRPSGGSLQASCTNFCSTSPLILTLSGRGGWGLGSNAAAKPSVTRRLRTRSTVRSPTPRASTTSGSGWPLPWEVSANSRMRAWVSLRAAPLPAETVRSNCPRSSAVKVTRYFSTVPLLLLRGEPRPRTQVTEYRITRQSKIDGILAEATMAEIKVCEPVSVPVSVLQELQELRSLLGRLRSEVQRLTQENDRLRQENQRLEAELEQS